MQQAAQEGKHGPQQTAGAGAGDSLHAGFQQKKAQDKTVQRAEAFHGADLAKALRNCHKLRVDDPHHAYQQG